MHRTADLTARKSAVSRLTRPSIHPEPYPTTSFIRASEPQLFSATNPLPRPNRSPTDKRCAIARSSRTTRPHNPKPSVCASGPVRLP